MNRLERRYRRLVNLLPVEHRAARGEELLGLLLDIDEGRTRPSLRQATGVLLLALRLRWPRMALPAFTAFLVAIGTQPLADLVTMYIAVHRGPLTVELSPGRYPLHGWVLLAVIPALAWLAVPVAWILGARRTAVAALAVLLAYQVYGLGWVVLTGSGLAVLVVLAFAARRTWQTPRQHGSWLATVPVAALLWVAVGFDPALDPRLAWPCALAGALTALIVSRGRRWPTVLVAVASGLGAGWFAPAVLRYLIYLRPGWPLAITAVTALLATFLGGREPARPRSRSVVPGR